MKENEENAKDVKEDGKRSKRKICKKNFLKLSKDVKEGEECKNT